MRARVPVFPWPRSAEDGTPLGVDVAALRRDIARLVTAGYGASAASQGIDPDDLVQETCVAILRRNRFERSAFDPRRGTFGHYVCKVASCQLSNMLTARGPPADASDDEVLSLREADAVLPDERLIASEELATMPLWRLAIDARRASPEPEPKPVQAPRHRRPRPPPVVAPVPPRRWVQLSLF